jgi:hypothetical protein
MIRKGVKMSRKLDENMKNIHEDIFKTNKTRGMLKNDPSKKIENILKDVKLMELNKLTVSRFPDPFSDKDSGYIAFYGNHPIPSKGRNDALRKTSSELTFGECHFLTRESCVKNALWYIGYIRSLEKEQK